MTEENKKVSSFLEVRTPEEFEALDKDYNQRIANIQTEADKWYKSSASRQTEINSLKEQLAEEARKRKKAEDLLDKRTKADINSSKEQKNNDWGEKFNKNLEEVRKARK